MLKKVSEYYYKESTPKQALGELATCFKGRNLATHDDGQGVAMISLSNIDSQGQIAYDQLKYASSEEISEKHFLQDGDVLVATKGTVKKVAVFQDQGFPIIASANLSILRTKEQLRPHYLKLFLDSQLGKSLLDEADRGRGVMNISRKNLLNIYIPIIPLVKQDYLIQQYLQGLRDYQRKVARAEQEWRNRLDQIERNLLG